MKNVTSTSSLYKPSRFYYSTYIISSLKESAIISGSRFNALSPRDYTPDLLRGIRALGVYITKDPLSARRIALDYRLEVLTGGEDQPWQARAIIRCPSGWEPERFQSVALKMWSRCPWIAHTDIVETAWGEGRYLPFLERDWDGRFNARDGAKAA